MTYVITLRPKPPGHTSEKDVKEGMFIKEKQSNRSARGHGRDLSESVKSPSRSESPSQSESLTLSEGPTRSVSLTQSESPTLSEGPTRSESPTLSEGPTRS
jgi:hypothetical protein